MAADISAKNTDNVFKTQPLLEKLLNVKGMTIDSSIPYSTISKSLEQNCSVESIAAAKQQFQSSESTRNLKLMSDYTPLKTRIRFNLLKRAISTVAKTDKNSYCQQKYYAYNVLELIQNFYDNNHYIINGGITQDIGIQSLGDANLITKQKVTDADVSVMHTTENFDAQEKVFVDLGDNYMKQTIADLASKGILSQEDLTRIDGKIYVNYINQCGTMHGSFSMTQKP
jgi:hypothetical protein